MIYNVLNGDIFNDLEWHLTQILIVRYYLTLIISEMVQNRDTVTMKRQ